MELMADEMADFKTALLELQKRSEQLAEMSIPISTEALEKHLNSFLQKQEAVNEKRNEILKGIDSKLKNARLIPNYLLILLGIAGILALGLVSYFGYKVNENRKGNFELSQMIMESQNKLYEDYFASYPEIQETYCKWLEENK